MSGATHASGVCRTCGQHTDCGRVIMSVEKVSGPGLLVLACPACDAAPAADLSPAAEHGPDVETAAGFCEDCGRYVARGMVLGDVSQGSGPGFIPVLCAGCDQGRSERAAARDALLRATDKPGRGLAS